MPTKDVVDIFVQVLDKLEFYWNFYTLGLITVIGWLVTAKKPIPRRLRVLIAGAYAIFVYMIVRGLRMSYLFANAIRADLLGAANRGTEHLQETASALPTTAGVLPHTNVVLANTTDALETISYGNMQTTAVVIQIVLLILVWCAIFFTPDPKVAAQIQ